MEERKRCPMDSAVPARRSLGIDLQVKRNSPKSPQQAARIPPGWKGVYCPPTQSVRMVHKHACHNLSTGLRGAEDSLAVCGSDTTHDYEFKYDDGYSARIGAVRLPLILRQPGREGDFIWRHPPHPLARPSRILKRPPRQLWQDVCFRYHYRPKPAPCPRYFGVHIDPTIEPPNETIIRHF